MSFTRPGSRKSGLPTRPRTSRSRASTASTARPWPGCGRTRSSCTRCRGSTRSRPSSTATPAPPTSDRPATACTSAWPCSTRCWHEPAFVHKRVFASWNFPRLYTNGGAMSVSEKGLKATVMDADQIRRSLSRIAHEIVERNRGAGDVLLVGVYSRGDHLARRLAAQLEELEGHAITVGAIDVSEHRDDRHLREPAHRFPSEVPDVDGKVVVLVDDVIHHGRTARAAMDALMDFGRPRAIQLAVLVDRGHRELPIRPDYVGKNVPTSDAERVEVRVAEEDGQDQVVIVAG